MLLPVADLPIPELVENRRRSIAMLAVLRALVGGG
jgi:hypothetical protein